MMKININLYGLQAQKSALSASVGSIKGELTKARSCLSQVVSTDGLKKGVNGLIKGMRGWFK